MIARRVLAAARSAVTLVSSAMLLFGEPRPLRERPTIAIVRMHEHDLHDGYDPRELIRERIVLTLPFDAANDGSRAAMSQIHVN